MRFNRIMPMILMVLSLALLAPSYPALAEERPGVSVESSSTVSSLNLNEIYVVGGGSGGSDGTSRQIPYASTPNYPTFPNNWGPAREDGQWRSIAETAMWKVVFTRAEAKAYADQKKGKVVFNMNPPPRDTKAAESIRIIPKPKNMEEYLAIIRNYRFVGPGHFRGVDGATAPQTLGVALFKGMESSATLAMPIFDNYSMRLTTEAKAKGIAVNFGGIGGDKIGFGGSGVLGYAKANGSAGYVQEPCLDVNFFAPVTPDAIAGKVQLPSYPLPLFELIQAENERRAEEKIRREERARKEGQGLVHQPEYNTPSGVQKKSAKPESSGGVNSRKLGPAQSVR